MAELPPLTEAAQRKLDLQWEELCDSHISNLDLYSQQIARAEMRTGHLRTSYESTIMEHLLNRTSSLAKSRLQQIAEAYLHLWASIRDARSKTFMDWLPAIQTNTISEISQTWATSDFYRALFESTCRGKLEDDLSSFVQTWRSRARRLEIQHLETPQVSLASLIASNGDLGFAVKLERVNQALEATPRLLDRLEPNQIRPKGLDDIPIGKSVPEARVRQGAAETTSPTVLFGASRPVTIVRRAGTAAELRWDTSMGGDFDAKALFHTSDKVMPEDEIHCVLFDQPRIVVRVKPVVASGEVSHWEAVIAPRPPSERVPFKNEVGVPLGDESEVTRAGSRARRGKVRSKWLDAQSSQKLWTSDLEIVNQGGPSYNTIQRYRSGKESTRDAYVRGLLAKAFGRKISEVPE